MTDLSGRAAIVTGASRGLGRGIALALAEQGADVVVNYVSAETQAREVVAQITEPGRRALAVKADASEAADVERLFQATLEHFGRLDILVNNAGTSQPKDIFQIEADDWDRIIRTNLTSCFLCSQAAMRIMARQKSGRIVNISSVVGHQGALFGRVHYAATKSGMLGMTRTLARTGAPPGPIASITREELWQRLADFLSALCLLRPGIRTGREGDGDSRRQECRPALR